MRKSVTISLWLCAILLLPGCLRTVDFEKHDPVFIEQAREQQWKKLAVLPFSGNHESRDVVTDWFAHKLRIEKLIEIIRPSVAKTALKKHAIIIVDDEQISLPEAKRLGAILEVDVVAVGSIEGLVVSVSLVDVASGTVIATSVHSPKQNFTLADYNLEIVTDRVCRDMVAVLQEMTAQRTAPATGR